MAINNFTLREAEEYLARFERLRDEIDYGCQEFRRRLDFYRQSPNPQTSVDLESSVAFFEKHISPFAVEKRAFERHYSDPRDILEIGINQDWRAYEFRQLFQGVDYFNKLFAVRFKLTRESPDLRLRREMTRSRVFRYAELYYYLAPHEELQVKSVQFASPGSVNLEGISGGTATLSAGLEETESLNYSAAEQWASAASLPPQNPDDPIYQQYLLALIAEKTRQREEWNREADTPEEHDDLCP